MPDSMPHRVTFEPKSQRVNVQLLQGIDLHIVPGRVAGPSGGGHPCG